jgi:dCTP deaminase
MPVKSDGWIRRMALEHRMIEPFAPEQVREGKISFGTSSYGYDMRVGDEFKIFTPKSGSVLDPKQPSDGMFVSFTGNVCEIPSHSFVLARSVEYFRIPRDILTICFGKSTYARCGIVVNVTPFEPEWEGFVTMAILNTSPVPVRIYANEGIAQVIFLKADEVCETSYADKKGKYQAQKTITAAKV